MRRRLVLPFALVLVVGLAALTAAATVSAQTPNTLSIVGPWTGADEQSFRAVLADFQQQNPSVTVTYTAAPDGVASAVSAAAASSSGTKHDVAVLSLPAELEQLQTLARAGTLKPIEFAVPAVRANYSASWKRLGSLDGKLFALPVKATNRSAFWFDQRLFRNGGLAAPTSWRALLRVSDALTGKGLKPFAVSGANAIALPGLFQNIYLMLQGNKRYDMLMRGAIPWTDATVRDSLRAMRGSLVPPSRIAGGLDSLESPFKGAVQNVFGSPVKGAMVIGGSDVIPVLQSAKAVRPLTQFGVFPFPTTDGKGAPRVIGDAQMAVMLEDTPASRAFVNYLATPQAAEIWAKRDIAFLSPHRKVDLRSYAPAVRPLATALARATVFRFGIADAATPEFKATLNRLLAEYVRSPGRLSQITAQLQAAATRA
jgi:ABC-type glycerol-3-phosphate transport system substrate-binding protein